MSLIDSPGLNIDSVTTTSLFSKQEEIDVIVFVVNAENHFTLSGREFLITAGKEKAYIFIVVNRFDQIRRKDRCKRDILEQIKQISPMTYEHVDNLVHFVAAKHTLQQIPDKPDDQPYISDFNRLEQNLRSFILEKRSRSKLAPAKIYLTNLMGDLSSLCQYNYELAELRSLEITNELSESAPSFERMNRIKEQFLDNIDRTIDETGDQALSFAKSQLGTFMESIDSITEDIEWNGVMGMWSYARQLRNTIYKLAALRLRRCEDFARKSAVACVKNFEELANSCMETPPSIDISVVTSAFDEGTQEAGKAAAVSMFIPLELSDFFDFTDKVEVLKEYLPSFGLIMAGVFGYRGLAGGLLRGAAAGGSGKAKVGFMGLALAGVGLFLYTLSDMKSLVDKKVITKMKSHLTSAGLIEGNSDRISRGIKRVLRLAIWDFQNQFQRVLSENQKRRDDQTHLRRKAELTKDNFKALATRAGILGRMVEEIDLDA
ncbi:mitofusin [Blyttiomyces sp. JEL0837]|nr:mitofusin [Blyttiomyces sp. JEL0837]